MVSLTDGEEMKRLASYSLSERASFYSKKLGVRVGKRKISQIYKMMGIKKRPLRRYVPTNREETALRLLRLEKLRNKVMGLMKQKKLLIFVDECTFSPKSYQSRVWQMPG